MEFSLASISTVLALACLLFTSNFHFAYGSELIVNGKIGEKPLVIYSPVEREVKLICNPNNNELETEAKTSWTFFRNGQVRLGDMALECEEAANDKLKLDCAVSKDGRELRLDDVDEQSFGEYVCYSGSKLRNQSFVLRELAHLTRKVKDGDDHKVQRSLTVLINENLCLYCNVTGLPVNSIITWWKDSEDITEMLNSTKGIFQNFTRESDFSFCGDAQLIHRGKYKCEVDTTDAKTKPYYPVKFSFMVRVKVGDEWKYPLYILLGESGVVGLLTILFNWRDKRREEREDIVIEDSEDEDEDEPRAVKHVNGAQNNNSNGK